MTDMNAELYRNPDGKFIRTGTLADILQQFRSFASFQKANYFIRHDGKTYLAHEVDKLQAE